MRRNRSLAVLGVAAVAGAFILIQVAAPAAERRAYNRCLEIAPPFPFRSERITVDWRLGLPPYECVYWFKERIVLRQ